MKLLKNIYLLAVYAFLYLPLVIIVIFAFNNSRYSLLWHGFTLHWFHVLWHDKGLHIIAGHSLLIASLASTCATLLGALAATCLIRYRFFAKQSLYGLIYILIVIPDIVIAIALLLLYNTFKIPLGFTSLLLAHTSFCLPFATILIYSRMQGLNKHLFEAAQDLGASDLTIFSKITLPSTWPALLAAWLLSFTLSLDDVIVSFFVSGPSYQILPLWIYSMVKIGINPEVNALCSIMIFATLTVVLIAQFVLREKS